MTAVDVGEAAVELARANAVRNGLAGVMDFVCADVFDLLPSLEGKSGYDFIILDPPAFTKARRTAENAMRGYKEINYRAMKLLPRGGYLATASCSHFATEAMFVKMLQSAGGRAPPAAPDRGAPAGAGSPHPVGRRRNKLPQIFPVSGHLTAAKRLVCPAPGPRSRARAKTAFFTNKHSKFC